MLASLTAALQELKIVLVHFEDVATWEVSLRQAAQLANQICGECVPQEHSPRLTRWMDQIQNLASTISPMSAPH